MFIDDKGRGDPDGKYGYPWRAVHVGDLDNLAEIATQAASIAARSPKKVNFCPPVATFTGTDKATEADLCQGLAIMVELDEQPDQSRPNIRSLARRAHDRRQIRREMARPGPLPRLLAAEQARHRQRSPAQTMPHVGVRSRVKRPHRKTCQPPPCVGPAHGTRRVNPDSAGSARSTTRRRSSSSRPTPY